MNATKDKEQVQSPIRSIYRLTPSQYEALEKKALTGLSFRDDTQAVQSGYLNGVEAVLRLVRQGFTA